MKIYLSMQNVRIWEDLLYKEIKSTLTVANSNAKLARYLD